MTDKNTPAFPRVIQRFNETFENCEGMTLRDYFAAHAIVGQLSNRYQDQYSDERHAKRSYEIADAMLSARRDK